MITVITGLPGSGKSIDTANRAMQLLKRNYRWWKKTGQVRKVISNIKFSEFVEKKYGSFIGYWDDPLEICAMKDVDIIWDEIATHLDSTQWQNLPLGVKRFLQQHRKRGIDIYANTQSFKTIDVSMRRLVERLYFLQKLFGSRSPSATRPPVRFVWGFVLKRLVDPDSYEGEKVDYAFKSWNFFWIDKNAVKVFNTGQEILIGKYPPLRHMIRECEDPKCDFQKIIHA